MWNDVGKVRNVMRLRYDFFSSTHFWEKWMRQQFSFWFTRYHRRVGRVHGNWCWCVANTHMHFAWYYSFKRVIIKLLNYKCWSEHVLQKMGLRLFRYVTHYVELACCCCQKFLFVSIFALTHKINSSMWNICGTIFSLIFEDETVARCYYWINGAHYYYLIRDLSVTLLVGRLFPHKEFIWVDWSRLPIYSPAIPKPMHHEFHSRSELHTPQT